MSGERSAYRLALAGVAVAVGAVGVVGAGVAAVVAGPSASFAAAAGAAVALLSGLATPAAMLVARERSPEAFGAIVGGSWLAKILVIVAIGAALAGVEGFHGAAFAWTLLAGVAATLGVDLWAVRRARVPYVMPDSKSSG